eukprot:scaffold1488_cov141-Amphora_coffeaeformis.AAC.3
MDFVFFVAIDDDDDGCRSGMIVKQCVAGLLLTPEDLAKIEFAVLPNGSAHAKMSESSIHNVVLVGKCVHHIVMNRSNIPAGGYIFAQTTIGDIFECQAQGIGLDVAQLLLLVVGVVGHSELLAVDTEQLDDGGDRGRMARFLELTNTPSALTVPSELASNDFVLRPGVSRRRSFLPNEKTAMTTKEAQSTFFAEVRDELFYSCRFVLLGTKKKSSKVGDWNGSRLGWRAFTQA